MPGPRTEETKLLERTRRQVFQWYILEKLPSPKVKELMDQLSSELIHLTGESYIFPERVWEGRINYWNKRSLESWNISVSRRERNVPIPANISHEPLWRAWDTDAEDLKKLKVNLLSRQDMGNQLGHLSTAVSTASQSTEYAPASSLNCWRRQEDENWGGNSNIIGENGLYLDATAPANIYSNKIPPVHPYALDTASNHSVHTQWLSTPPNLWHKIHPPQLPCQWFYDIRQAPHDGRTLTQPFLDGPRDKLADFNLEPRASPMPCFSPNDMSYISHNEHNNSPSTFVSTQPNQHQLNFSPGLPDLGHTSIYQGRSDYVSNMTIPYPFESPEVAGTLPLPFDESFQHTMALYGDGTLRGNTITCAEGSKKDANY